MILMSTFLHRIPYIKIQPLQVQGEDISWRRGGEAAAKGGGSQDRDQGGHGGRQVRGRGPQEWRR